MVRPIYLIAGALLNAAGDEASDLHGAAPTPQPLAFDPARRAHAIATPRLPVDLFDRKIQRSVEPQGLRLLHCAARLATELRALELPPERVGLTAAIPEVDAPSPCWDAVEAIRSQPEKPVAALFANTPPLHALTLLNSSVMAYVAEALRCNGPMGGYCSQANAGLDALIEAVLQIAEGRADAMLMVSTSPNLTPALYLREPSMGEADAEVHGEGAAALLLAAAPAEHATQRVRVVGFARGYGAIGERATAVVERVLKQALKDERLNLSDVEQIVADPADPLLNTLLGRHRPLQSSRSRTGNLGASSLPTEVLYALGDPGYGDVPRHALLLNRTSAGHCGALLLAIDYTEKGA
ncbi:beta-ketoacyl synthase [Pseudomonas sp. RIT-PI-AD]|uniref:beta-ketoacyl synthase n=1 Tax=Pseudomonas sp. RIT-PI-AD TaxID=3035294 RepID=UPI0021D90C81|nr:beta-ketoacyl synthase [Pseudomonas sp. RIT-PI-AD]